VRLGDDDTPVTARVAGADPSTDLAVLRVDPSATRSIRPLALADSDDVTVGDAAIAIGFPLGLDRTATQGIVSGVGRQIEAPNGFSIDEVIQTDAPINPGNSGGPLLDARGRVIGVNSQIATAGAGGGNVGIGFAVPSDTVREVVPRLKAGGSVERAWLGVSTAPATSGTGAQVGAVTAGGPADDAGLRPGDVIRAVDGRAIGEPDDVADAVAAKRPGDRVAVVITRGSGEQTLALTLGTRPASAAAATGGARPQQPPQQPGPGSVAP
jgi:putative serine protease PepD